MSATCVALLAILQVATAAGAACWDSGSGFTQQDWGHCQVLGPDMLMYYKTDPASSSVKLGLHAAAHTDGWSALAFAGNGGMKGASQVVVRQENGGWVAEDRNSVTYGIPSMDAVQDVQLLWAQQSAGGTSWAVTVMNNSCDEEDYPIEDKSVWMHWALGESHEFESWQFYHKTSRGQFHANLFRAPMISPSTAGFYKVDLRMPNVSVVLGENGTDESNPYICSFFDMEELMPDHNMSVKHHAARMSPYLNGPTEQYVHHMILYGCDAGCMASTGRTYGHLDLVPECESMPECCYEMKWPWAVGSQDIIFPDDVGMPFGEGSTWLVVQMHYYNPGLDTGVVDSSGVTVYFDPALRPTDAAVMQVNGGTSPGMRPDLPPGEADLVLPTFVVPPACTGLWEEPITVLGLLHHGHLVGQSFKVEVVRDGENLGVMRKERVFDFNHQSLEESSISPLLPGDELVFTCAYDTTGRTAPTSFGDLSQQEMCWSAFMYYPAQSMSEAFYVQPPENTSELVSWWQEACTTAGADGFEDVSSCAQDYVHSPESLKGEKGYNASSAVDFCNDPGIYRSWYKQWWPNACPPCHEAEPWGNCTDADVKAWGQSTICLHECSKRGMSVYPDTSKTTPTFTHLTYCGFIEPFTHTPVVHTPTADLAGCGPTGALVTSASRATMLSAAVLAAMGGAAL